ncbi:hypothetical protein Tco_0944683 [Tanacetum coccineum]
MIRPMIYDGSVIAKETNMISIADSKEILMHEEESRSKMILKQNFGKRFIPQQELSNEQAFQLQTSHPNTDQFASSPVKIEAPRELPKVTEVQTVFNHMEAAVHQYFVDKQYIVNIVVNSSVDMNTSVNVNSPVPLNDYVNYVKKCNKCLELKAELIKHHNMVKKDEYNRLLKSFSKLEQHCISIELAMQLNKEIFQKNNTSMNQTKPTFDHLFELNNLKAEPQAKDTTIKKLKAKIKRLNKTSTTNSVKKGIDEIETINLELEHRLAKLIAEIEHLKQTYKELYDSIKPSRVCAKEHVESLVHQLNQKSIEITDLNAQLQEKVFVITTLKNDLRKVKGKDIVDNASQMSNATTTAPGRYKLDLEIVEQDKSLNPLDSASYCACKYVKLIQELLGYVRDTFLDIHKSSKKLVAITPINRKKIVRFAKPVISSSTSQQQLGSSQTQAKQTTNNSVLTFTRISSSTQKKNKVEDHSRIVKLCLNKPNYVVEPSENANVQHSKLNTNSELMCVKCNSSMFDARHELCFLEFISDMNARRTFILVGNVCPLTRITTTNKVPLREPIPLEIVLWYLDSECSKHMTGDRSQLTNFVHKFLGTVKFGNDHIAKIMGYGDYQIGNVTISRVYYVEGLGHNLFSVGQFCDSNLDVAFRKHMCFVRNLEGVDLLSGYLDTNLYTLSIKDMMVSSPICLLSKASMTKSWL